MPIDLLESLVWGLTPLLIAAVINLFKAKMIFPIKVIYITGVAMSIMGFMLYPQCFCSGPREIIQGAILFSLFINLCAFSVVLVYQFNKYR